MSDEKKLSEQVRNCAYIVPDPHPTDTEAGEREVLGLNQVADEIAALEQRLADAEANTQAAIDAALNPRLWTKEMSDAWHKALPDTELAFKNLRESAIAAVESEK